MARRLLLNVAAAAVLASSLAGCRASFDPRLYPNPEALYAAGMLQYQAKKWDNAAKAFEKLTRDLPARDPLLPLSYYYLGKSQGQKGDHLLAAQSFNRVADAFPEDSLAPSARYEAGYEYSRMWTKPELDATYGAQAQNALNTLLALYPESPYTEKAQALLRHIDNLYASKDFKTGYSYFRRRAYDSAIIYFTDVIRNHPDAEATRDAYLYLVESYRKVNYKADAADACDAMRKAYPNDREVIKSCGSASSAAASTPRT